MRYHFLRALLLLVLILGVVGYIRGWFSVSEAHNPADDKVHLQMSIDPNKVKDDAHRLDQLPGEAIDKIKSMHDRSTEDSNAPSKSRP